jgi:hypothetical protein
MTVLESTEHRDAMAAAWQRFFETYGVPPDRRRVPELAPVTHTPRSFVGIGPVRLAAATGDAALARLLLDHGADPAARSDDGKLPADMARERGHLELAASLGA